MNFTRSSSETMTSFQATLVNTGFGQLVLRDSLGKVAQKWTLSNPKCVIGSGTNCNVSCQLPGIVDHHVLMVIGAKQVFIRAMAPGLTRNGQNINELVVPANESEFNFEIAGHHFQFSREGISTPVTKEFVQDVPAARPLFATTGNDAPSLTVAQAAEPVAPQRAPVIASQLETVKESTALIPSRLKFTVVRALEKSRQASENMPSIIDNQLSSGRPAWVEAIVRDALRPVEERLDDLNGPLQNIERRLRRQRAQLRKKRKLAQNPTDMAPLPPQFVPVLAPELIQSQALIEQYVQDQTSQLESVTRSVGQIVNRLSDVDRQLSTTQADRQELSHQFQQSNQQIISLQTEMTALFNGLQNQLSQPSTAQNSSEARLWQSNIEAQLAELQVTLLTLDDIKTTLQAAIEQNRLLKGDLEVQQQKFGKIVAESTQKAVADALAQSSNDSETIGQVVGDKVCDSLREQLGTRFTGEIAQQLSDSLNNDFSQPLTSQLTSQLSEQLSNQFTQQLSGELTRQLATLTPTSAAAPNNDQIVEAVRGTLTELLAPLASTLQNSLQQTIQVVVDQSLQQSVQQTIAPMIEAATAAQVRSAALMAMLQTPATPAEATTRASAHQAAVQPTDMRTADMLAAERLSVADSALTADINDSRPADASPSYEEELDEYEQSSSDASAESSIAQSQASDREVSDSQAYSGPSDPSQGFDSQPYSPPGYERQAESAPVYDSQAYSPVSESQAFDSQPYDSQAYDSQATPVTDSQAFDSQAFDSQAYDFQAYTPVTDSQAYDSQAYDSQAYTPVTDSQAFDSQAYVPVTDSQAYDSQAYDSQAYTPATDSQAYDSQAHDSQAYAPVTDSQAYDSQAYDSQAYDSRSYAPEANATADSEPVETHQELPSWWSDDAAAASRSTENPISADNDANFRDISERIAGGAPSAEDNAGLDAYAQSAFSAEQLELGATDQRSASLANRGADVDGDYDSVPYSELVNRKPSYRDEDLETDEPEAEMASGYSPYDSQAREMVPVGADYDQYPGESYSEYASESTPDIAQPEHLTQSVPVAENPTVSAAETQSGEDSDESVEDYMRRLLARMRGVSESEVSLPGVDANKPAPAPVVQDPSVAKPAVVTQATHENEQISEAWTEPFDPEKYVPRGTAPEKNRDLNALRELANTSARSAIQVSARRRQGSAILIKSAIALVGLVAGIALVSINGARINVAFIATIASFLVAVIWGYDATTSIRPLLQANRHQKNTKRDTDKAVKAEADAQ